MTETKGRYIIDFHDIPSKRHGMPELEVENRVSNFDEVELGLSEEDAQAEAKRCLSCRRCLGCELCLAACENRAIVFQQDDEIIDLVMDEVIMPDDVGCNMAVKKGENGYGLYKNVITAFELESMLSETGPYGGMMLRPYDGDLPKTVAFVLNAGKEDQQKDALVSYVMEEAAQAKKKISDLDVTVFVPAALQVDAGDVTLIKGDITDVREAEDTRNIVVKYSDNGSEKDGAFDMLVIAKSPEIVSEIKELREILTESA